MTNPPHAEPEVQRCQDCGMADGREMFVSDVSGRTLHNSDGDCVIALKYELAALTARLTAAETAREDSVSPEKLAEAYEAYVALDAAAVTEDCSDQGPTMYALAVWFQLLPEQVQKFCNAEHTRRKETQHARAATPEEGKDVE